MVLAKAMNFRARQYLAGSQAGGGKDIDEIGHAVFA
jgi:hypothetical protein